LVRKLGLRNARRPEKRLCSRRQRINMIYAVVALALVVVVGWWERRRMLASFGHERNLWMQERSALLTRIQHWTPAEQPRAPGVEVQRPPKPARTVADRMAAAGLVVDESGLPRDVKTGIIWESLEEFESHLKQNAVGGSQ
jgi:hypothetical protein